MDTEQVMNIPYIEPTCEKQCTNIVKHHAIKTTARIEIKFNLWELYTNTLTSRLFEMQVKQTCYECVQTEKDATV